LPFSVLVDATLTSVTAFSGRSFASSSALVNAIGWGEGVDPRSCGAATGHVSFSGNAGGATQTGPSYWDDVCALSATSIVFAITTAAASTGRLRARAEADHRRKDMDVLR